MSCHLLIVSHDELGVIFDGLVDPLHPAVAVDLSSTAKGLRTPLTVALQTLKQQHETVRALCNKMHTSFETVRRGDTISWERRGASLRTPADMLDIRPDFPREGARYRLSADEMATLGLMIRTNGLPRLRWLWLFSNGFGDTGLHELCEGLVCGAPSLQQLGLGGNQISPAGAATLATAFGKGACRRLVSLNLGFNNLGKQGMTTLTAPLRKLPLLHALNLNGNEIGDEGVAALLAELGKDDFKKLRELRLDDNELTNETIDTLTCVLDSGALPNMRGWECTTVTVKDNAISDDRLRPLYQNIASRGRIPLSTEIVEKGTNIGGACTSQLGLFI